MLKVCIVLNLILFAFPKIYQAFSLVRHGARYHVMPFYDGDDTKPRWEELTAVGMRQHQRLGQLIRKQYIDSLRFLSPNYNSSEIQIFSTFKNRTISSAISFLYGLYPLGTGPKISQADKYLHVPPYSNKTDSLQQKFTFQMGYQPIKVKANEKVIITECPNYMKNLQINFDLIHDVANQMNIYYYPFMKRMSPLFNFSLQTSSLLTFTRIYDASSVDLYLGRPLPQGFTQNDYLNTKHLSNWYWLVCMTNNNSIMANTFKLQRIINTFESKMKLGDDYPLKWTHLLGHDTDVAALHLALNTSSPDCIQQLYRRGYTKAVQCDTGIVNYASNIIIQLHSENSKDFYVKVRSNGRYMKICSSGSYSCNYSEFKELISKSISSIDMDIICGKTIKNYS